MKTFDLPSFNGLTVLLTLGTREEAFREGFDVKDIQNKDKKIFVRMHDDKTEYFFAGDLEHQYSATELFLVIYSLTMVSVPAFKYMTYHDFFNNPEKYLDILYSRGESEVMFLKLMAKDCIDTFELRCTRVNAKEFASLAGMTLSEVKEEYNKMMGRLTETLTKFVLK